MTNEIFSRSGETMPEDDHVGPRREVVRVTWISEDRLSAHLEYRNGNNATMDLGQELDFELEIGSILALGPDPDNVELLPPETWPTPTWVGVIRLKEPDLTLVDTGGSIQVVRVSKVAGEVGNTVLGDDIQGVTEILHETPIRIHDLPELSDSDVAGFEMKSNDTDLGFDGFGGYEDVVARAQELIELPLLKHDVLKAIGARPIKGVLFTGPPGTGKTLLARIIANQADASFFMINGPEIFSKWYGQSEEVLRKVFDRAKSRPRSIIFFDEIDSVAGARDDSSHEASRRVVAQLLTLMDGFTAASNVVVIAATNRPQDIDQALRRPGRFDWEIVFKYPSENEREAILRVGEKRLRTLGDLPHAWVASKTSSWSPADLSAIWSEAALIAVADDRDRIATEDFVSGYERVADQRAKVALSKREAETRR